MGKYTKLPFPASDSRSTSILVFIHTNVSGRMSHVSLGGNTHVSLGGYEYYLIYIDDYSRRTCI